MHILPHSTYPVHLYTLIAYTILRTRRKTKENENMKPEIKENPWHRCIKCSTAHPKTDEGTRGESMTCQTWGQAGIAVDAEGISSKKLPRMIFPEMGDESRRYVYPVGDGSYHVVPPQGALMDFRWATKSIILGEDDIKGRVVRIVEKYAGSPTSLARYGYEPLSHEER